MSSNIFRPMEIDAIGEIMNISLGSSATAVSNMLDHRVDITTPSVSIVNIQDFVLGPLEPAIGVEIKYTSGLEGSNIMLLKMSDIKVIVDILMGVETEEEDFSLSDLTLSAVCEVMNQMMGAASTALSDLLGRMVNISTPQTFDVDDLETFKRERLPATPEPVVVVRFALSIESKLKSEFMNIMSVELARELIAGFGLDMDEAGPAAKLVAPGAKRSQLQAETSSHAEEPIQAQTAPENLPFPQPMEEGSVPPAQGEQRLPPAGQTSPPPYGYYPAPIPTGGQEATPPYLAYPPGYPMPPYSGWPGMLPTQSFPQPPEPKVIATKAPVLPTLANGQTLNIDEAQNLDLIMNVPLEITVEIGRTRKRVQEILSLTKGALVVLDKLAGDQVDLFVNGKCIARGDVVVVDDNFGLRISEIIQKSDLTEVDLKQ